MLNSLLKKQNTNNNSTIKILNFKQFKNCLAKSDILKYFTIYLEN